MNISPIKLFLLLLTLSLLTACSSVGNVVSNTGDLVSRTGKFIGGEKKAPEITIPKAPEAPQLKLPEAPKLPQVIEMKVVQPATAAVRISSTSALSQSRINVTILQLKSDGKFKSSRLSDLESDVESTLGSDLISKQSTSLKRGDIKTLNLEIDSATKALGIYASFQELNQTVWRTGVQLPKATDASYNVQVNVDNKLISAVNK